MAATKFQKGNTALRSRADGSMPATAQSAVRGVWGKLRTTRLMQRLLGCYDMTAMASGFTWQQIFGLPVPVGEPVILRAKYINSSGANTWTVSGVAWAAGSAVADINPKLADGTTNAAFVVAVSTGLANTFVVPVAPDAANGVMGVAYSPWSAAVYPIARIDGKTWPAIYLRTYATAAGAFVSGITNGGSGNVLASPIEYAQSGSNAHHACMIQNGDFTTTNHAAFAATTSQNYQSYPAVEIEARLLRDVVNIANVGDSTACATGPTGSFASGRNYVQRLIDRIAGPTRAIGQIQVGYIGKTSAYFHGKLREMLADASRPALSVAIMQGYSRNDDAGAWGQAAVDAGYVLLMQSSEEVMASGVAPMPRTAPPDAGCNTTAKEDIRLAYNARIRNSGFPYFDFDAAVTDGGYPAKIKAAYNFGDDIHINPAGYDAAQLRLAADLAKWGLI